MKNVFVLLVLLGLLAVTINAEERERRGKTYNFYKIKNILNY